jgi:hypothetical protein
VKSAYQNWQVQVLAVSMHVPPQIVHAPPTAHPPGMH